MMNQSELKKHTPYMRRCLELARRGSPHPNPYVGAILVSRGGVIVAEGYHRRAGEDHAEADCFKNFKKKGLVGKFTPKDLTLYVNLEPCCHFGSTSPCTDAIKEFGVKRVVFAITDPNRLVKGKGANILRQRGVSVQYGVLAKDARKLNEQFIHFSKTQRSFFAVKVAATVDGKIATHSKDSKWITSTAMRAYTRTLRSRYQAIIVGIETVLADDPHLGARKRGARDPLRIVLDSRLRIPLSAQALRDSQAVVACVAQASARKQKALQKQGIGVWVCKSDKRGMIDLFDLAEKMYDAKIISALIEGGSRVSSSFIAAGLVDKVYWAIAPKIMGDNSGIPAVSGRCVRSMEDVIVLERVSHQSIGADVLIEGYVRG